MANKVAGVNPFAPATAVAEHELGLVVDSPVGGFGAVVLPNGTIQRYDAGAKFMYVQANGTIAAGDALQVDTAFGSVPADREKRHATVIITSGATQPIVGLAMTGMNTTTLKFGFIQIAGKHHAANVADAVADGALLVSAAAGAMVVSGATAAEAQAIAAGRAIRKLADATEIPGGTGLTNKGYVHIQD